MTSDEIITVIIGKPKRYRVVLELTDEIFIVLEDVTQVLCDGVNIVNEEEIRNG